MGAIVELLAVWMGDAPILLHLALVVLACCGAYALFRSGRRSLALLLLIFFIALDPTLLLIRYRFDGNTFVESLSFYLEDLSVYLSPWIVAGISWIFGIGLYALALRNLKWASISILCCLLIAFPTVLRFTGADGYDFLSQLGWGFEYMGLLTPLIIVSIFALLPLKNLTPRKERRSFLPGWMKIAMAALILCCYAAMPFMGNDYTRAIAASIGINAIALYGLNIVSGLCGRVSFAQWALVGMGAYTVAILDLHAGIPPLLALPMAALVGVFSGGLLGLLSFMKNLWLGLATILIASMAVYAFMATDIITGGPSGMMISDSNRTLVYYLVGFFLAVSIAFTEYLKRTTLGRKMIAVREGAPLPFKNTYLIKIMSFALSGLFAGISGGLLAAEYRFINPSTFEMHEAVTGIIILVVGGLGSTIGPLISTIVLKVLPELLRPYPTIRFIPITYFFVISVFIYWYVFRIQPKKKIGIRNE